MRNSKNEMRLSGILRQDPVIVNFADNKRLARFTLGVSKLIQSKPAPPQWSSTDFNVVVSNERLDKVRNQLKKGTEISLKGYLATVPYTNKHRELVETIEIIANRIDITAVDTAVKSLE